MLRSVKYGLYGAVLAGLVAAPVVWSNVDKSVNLTVDGKPVAVSTTASTVGDMLKDEGYAAGKHDIVSRAKRLPLDPTAIAIRTPRMVTVVHDGRRDSVSTTQPTVELLLADLKITRAATDKLSVPPTTATAQGQTITLQRVGTKTLTRTVKVDYKTSRKDDKGMKRGDTKVITEGRNGKAQVTYVVTLVDGKQTASRKIRTVTVAEARTKVIAVGTKKVEFKPAGAEKAATPNPGSARAFAKQFMQSKYDWGDNQYDCLSSLWGKESGWRVNAANPSGAYGIPQALPGSKMASAGPDWETNGETQVKWGLGYIKSRYNTPCGAWSFWQANNYY